MPSRSRCSLRCAENVPTDSTGIGHLLVPLVLVETPTYGGVVQRRAELEYLPLLGHAHRFIGDNASQSRSNVLLSTTEEDSCDFDGETNDSCPFEEILNISKKKKKKRGKGRGRRREEIEDMTVEIEFETRIKLSRKLKTKSKI
ncbi:hypothetical protein EVAR_23953_1 [Eumeta japonica]|uniref:Uncharacterized protein n=1 Tax=Eumeta variegata TaxID=151549 RepID=A0A4C1V2P9_EUMVA|nr:hypothetical protein EVAR_23953_1 [Eumeta japonica]